jgi:hypothetical protein
MFLHVTEVQYPYAYVIRIRFNNGSEGEVGLSGKLKGDVFGPLQDIERYNRFHVDPELGQGVWENEADFAPEFLHENFHFPV